MVELRIKSRPDIKNSYSCPLHHTPLQKPGILVKKKDVSISAFFLHQIPVLNVHVTFFFNNDEMEAEKINANVQNKRIVSA